MNQHTDLAAQAATDLSHREFLVFSLGDEEYAIDILKVQEIRGYENVTRIANAPAFIKGVTNLRGVIVPIVDLRIKFRLERVEYGGQTVALLGQLLYSGSKDCSVRCVDITVNSGSYSDIYPLSISMLGQVVGPEVGAVRGLSQPPP